MLTVLNAGLFTTVQDCGRWGYQGYGVPVSGAMDLFALCIANALVGNAFASSSGLSANPRESFFISAIRGGTRVSPQMTTNHAALEIHSPVTLQSDDPHLLALTGAEGSFQIDGRLMPQWSSVFARGGSLVEIAPAKPGGWLYLAIHGGIAVPRVLGSRSTFMRGGFGRALEAGDVIPVGAATVSDLVGGAGKSIGQRARSFAPPRSRGLATQRDPRDARVRVVLGPHDERFSADAIEHLTQTEYVVTAQADRMGYRLSGLPLARRGERSLDLATPARELVSCGVPLGAIQVPPDGLPIVLMADHQTTGGYPIIATVIAADVALVAQRAAGEGVRFRAVDVEEAQRAWIEMWEIIEDRRA